ncbi:hypothetical protein Tco_0853085 [Tanacetum coccineum]
MCTYLKNIDGWKPKDLKNKSFANIQELFDKAMKRVNTFVDMDTELVEESSKKAEAEIAQESSSKRAGEALEQESSKKKKLEEDKESTKKGEEGIYFQRESRDQSKNFKKTELVNYMDTFLHLNLKTMFEHHLKDNIWKNQQGLVKVLNWKLYDSCGVHCVTMQNILYYRIGWRRVSTYQHTRESDVQYVKLQVINECEKHLSS